MQGIRFDKWNYYRENIVFCLLMPNEQQENHHPSHLPSGPPAVVMQERPYFSRALGRSQPYACYLPQDFHRSGLRYPMLLLLHGFGGSWRDWGERTRLTRYLAGREIIVVCPDLGNGWATNAVDGSERREDDLLVDLLPALTNELPLLDGNARAVAGLSMGGYAAVKLALKYPESFGLGLA